MHRHGYKGRKFGRERDQRHALIRSLLNNLIIHGSIETTLPKAKETVRFIEKLITKAKKNNLASRRLIISRLASYQSATKLVDTIVPQIKNRTSGHVRVKRTRLRTGDGAQLATISFVDKIDHSAKNNSESK